MELIFLFSFFLSSGKHISDEIELRLLRNSFRLHLRLLSNQSRWASVLFFPSPSIAHFFHCFFFIRTMSLHTRITSVFLHVSLFFYVGFFLFPSAQPPTSRMWSIDERAQNDGTMFALHVSSRTIILLLP